MKRPLRSIKYLLWNKEWIFEVKKYQFEGTTDKIVALEWKWFVKNPNVTVEPIVWEFHANVSDAINNKAMVRSMPIPSSASDINTLYGLKNIHQVKYKSNLDNVDYDEVIETLNVEGAEWDIINERPKSFEA